MVNLDDPFFTLVNTDLYFAKILAIPFSMVKIYNGNKENVYVG